MERVTLVRCMLADAKKLVSEFLDNDKHLTIDVIQYLEENEGMIIEYDHLWLVVCAALEIKEGECLIVTD